MVDGIIRKRSADVCPSPQAIVAVKSPGVAEGLASMNVATMPEKAVPSTAAIGIPCAVSAASATVADDTATAVDGPSSSPIVTETA